MLKNTSFNIGKEGSIKVRRQQHASGLDNMSNERNTSTLELLVILVPQLSDPCFSLNANSGFLRVKSIKLTLTLLLLVSLLSKGTMKHKKET